MLGRWLWLFWLGVVVWAYALFTVGVVCCFVRFVGNGLPGYSCGLC